MTEMNIPPDKSFGRTMAFILCAIAAYFYFKMNKVLIPLFVISAIFIILAQFKPKLLHPLNFAWTYFGFVMSKVTNPLFLTLVYFTLITPMGLLLRLVGKDILRLKMNIKDKSYWIEKENTRPANESMKVQF